MTLKTVWEIIKKVSPSLVTVILVVGIGALAYYLGHQHGTKSVQLDWERDKHAAREALDKLKSEYEQRETVHRAETERIANELEEARRQHEVALADQRSAYKHRLLLSQERAEVYQRQAEAGAVACRDLASHAARLDAALEEGRALVREFGETLRFRDRQAVELGRQILSDRKLMTGEANER